MPEFFINGRNRRTPGSLGTDAHTRPGKHELYQDSRDKWQAVYQDSAGLVDHGLTTSLWKAPGL
ncbi:hypothetical protein ACVXHA_19825 [Escherichia coli]